jgi:selenocysteine-specific elongation factor
MKSVIVGTAGHIDHGKTALVKALTGIDADRLEEEKRRGITIDLGFANLELNSPAGAVRLGFVDVPGHERFVRNMLAGAGGIDLLLFVISAEDGVMPQTREHFEICRLLQVPRGITVLTKCDLVDEETLAVVRMEVEEFLQGSFLDTIQAPLIEVSARTGAGLEQLKQELARVAWETPGKDARAPFRLPIDRVFTMKGFGTVVTGTLISGELRKEQEIVVLPAGRPARVRGLQVHGKSTDCATAGERTAVNLAGVAQEELERGMMLAQPGLLRPTRRLDVRLSLLADAPPLKNQSQVHLHHYTTETVAKVVLYEAAELLPGQSAWAELRTAAPLACAPGDRFIVRQFSPVTTIGGGVIVDVNPPRRMKFETRAAMLHEMSEGGDLACLQALVTRRDRRGLRKQEAIFETAWSGVRLDATIKTACQAKQMLCLEDLLVSAPVFERVSEELFQAVKLFHASNPLAGGMLRQELLEKSGLEGEFFTAALQRLTAARRLAEGTERVHLPGSRVQMNEDETASKQQIEQAFAAAGIKVPALKEVLAGVKIDLARAQKIVTLLLREKTLVKISDDLVFHQKTLEELKRQMA